jgi:hypothetical protein
LCSLYFVLYFAVLVRNQLAVVNNPGKHRRTLGTAIPSALVVDYITIPLEF